MAVCGNFMADQQSCLCCEKVKKIAQHSKVTWETLSCCCCCLSLSECAVSVGLAVAPCFVLLVPVHLHLCLLGRADQFSF